MNKKIIIGVLIIILITLLTIYLYNAGASLIGVKDGIIATTIPIANISTANPASVNCIDKGGRTKIEKRPDGAEYGLCYFDDNRACEEWTMYREECPIGGRRTTGYDTIDQNYCVWNGGETLAMENSKCTFKNGKVCSTIDFYNGKCNKEI